MEVERTTREKLFNNIRGSLKDCPCCYTKAKLSLQCGVKDRNTYWYIRCACGIESSRKVQYFNELLPNRALSLLVSSGNSRPSVRTMKEGLKSCPFCISGKVVQEEHFRHLKGKTKLQPSMVYFVQCKGCKAKTIGEYVTLNEDDPKTVDSMEREKAVNVVRNRWNRG